MDDTVRLAHVRLWRLGEHGDADPGVQRPRLELGCSEYGDIVLSVVPGEPLAREIRLSMRFDSAPPIGAGAYWIPIFSEREDTLLEAPGGLVLDMMKGHKLFRLQYPPKNRPGPAVLRFDLTGLSDYGRRLRAACKHPALPHAD
jgi:hypothetical protein